MTEVGADYKAKARVVREKLLSPYANQVFKDTFDREIAAALAQAAADERKRCMTEPNERSSVWLIEMGGKWWTTAHATRWQERVALVSPERPWTADPNLALGFARKSDAEAYMLYEGMSSLAKATEHIWIEARTRSLASERDALRAKNAELVAALDWTRLWIKTRCPQAARNDVVACIEAALATAGHTQRVREFVNELGNRIKITIEGPTSVSENILTKREFDELCLALANEGRVGAPSSPTFDEELAARLSGGIAELEPAITAALNNSQSNNTPLPAGDK